MVTRLGMAIGGGFALLGAALLASTSVRVTPRSDQARSPLVVRPVLQAAGDRGALAVPVQGYARGSLRDSWGDLRGGGRGHRGIDIMAGAGTPVVATTGGTVEKLFQSRLGGTTLYLRSADRRWQYYYAHLAGYARGLREGAKVRAGRVLGYVGDTGDAGPGNYHLHFGAARMRPGQGWWQGADENPYPLLADRRSRR